VTKGRVEIDRNRCKGCGLCTIACPKGLLSIGQQVNGNGFFYAFLTSKEKCSGCALCGEICPDIAIRVWR
jgi:2-oxoglutarate ferredoxin oxidoreductase subunit delta